LDKKERIKQVEEIKNYVKKLDGDVIIAGDFNQDPLEIDGFTDVGKYHGYSEKNTFMPRDVRIDYIFMSNDEIYSTTYNNLTDINLSDHYPIMANIKYKPQITIKDDWISPEDEQSIKEMWFKNKRVVD
ncbi:MAG: endonuclease/exonuclease/phosphatase family protein, partial [Peptostreptococcaceae bacterium]